MNQSFWCWSPNLKRLEIPQNNAPTSQMCPIVHPTPPLILHGGKPSSSLLPLTAIQPVEEWKPLFTKVKRYLLTKKNQNKTTKNSQDWPAFSSAIEDYS